MSDEFSETCEHCGRQLVWSIVVETLWTCPSCKTATHQEHPTCQHPSCAEWSSSEGDGYCLYHAAQLGKRASKEPQEDRSRCAAREESSQYLPRVDATCAHRGCSNAAGADGEFCRPHQWQEEHLGERYDPFDDFRQPQPGERTRACNPTFPTTTFGDHQPARSSKMGVGQRRSARPSNDGGDGEYSDGDALEEQPPQHDAYSCREEARRDEAEAYDPKELEKLNRISRLALRFGLGKKPLQERNDHPEDDHDDEEDDRPGEDLEYRGDEDGEGEESEDGDGGWE